MLQLNPNLLQVNLVHQKLRQVIAEHGLKETHHAFQDILKMDYEYLQTLFTQSTTSVPEPIQQKEAPSNTPNTVVSTEVKEKKPVKKAVKQEQTPPPAKEDTIESLVSSKFAPGMKILVRKDVAAEVEITPLPPAVLPKFSSATEAKQWQREQEEARRINNEQRGINPEGLLTIDNMRDWIEVNKLTYAQIARDIVGLPEYRVGEFAKQHGILSETAKRRAAIIAKSNKSNS